MGRRFARLGPILCATEKSAWWLQQARIAVEQRQRGAATVRFVARFVGLAIATWTALLPVSIWLSLLLASLTILIPIWTLGPQTRAARRHPRRQWRNWQP